MSLFDRYPLEVVHLFEFLNNNNTSQTTQQTKQQQQQQQQHLTSYHIDHLNRLIDTLRWELLLCSSILLLSVRHDILNYIDQTKTTQWKR